MAEESAAKEPASGSPQGSSGSGSHPAGPWEPPSLEEMQRMLPQYEFVGVLGKGGMGVVYKARQISLDRQVAVKVLPGDLIDDEDVNFVERFKHEARTMARMNHPAIVGVFDFGETPNGLLFFVMEFVDGTDVSRMILSNGPLPPTHALAITAHVCDALAYAHGHGVVHRDIKPANILINMEGQVKVADFGLAKGSDAKEIGLTRTNVALGTPDFVAPEALVAGMSIDGRADLYAIGVMLYQMLTGEIPRGIWTMPSAKVGADPRFDAIIAKAMQTDRESRYQTAHEVRTDLDRIMTMPMVKSGGEGNAAVPKNLVRQGRPTGHKPTSLGPRPPNNDYDLEAAEDKASRKKSPAGLFLAIGAVAVLAVGAFFMLPGHKPDEASPTADSNAGVEKAPVASVRPTPPEPAKNKASSNSPPPSPSTGKSGPKPPGPPSSPERVIGFAGRSYRLVLKELPWRQAKEKAESMGGHLAAINGKDEQEWARKTFHPIVRDMDLLWLGGQRKAADKPWEWITGEPMNYKDWGEGQGESSGSSNANMFLALHLDPNRPGWDAVDGDKPRPFLVEWDRFGTALSDSPPKGPTNLLSKVDVARDAIKGEWKKAGTGIEVEKAGGALALEFDYVTPEEYDFIVEFSVKGDGNNVNQYLSAQGHSFAWKFNLGGSSGDYGFDLLDNKPLNKRSEGSGKGNKVLKSGQRYRSEIQVRKDGLRALVDGEEIVTWHGDFNRLSMENFFKLRDSRHVGIGSYNRGVVFHRVELREAKSDSDPQPKSPSLAAKNVAPKSEAPPPAPESPPTKTEQPPPSNDPRLVQLEAGFQAHYESDAQKPYLAAVAALNQSYINSGIARFRTAAQAGGRPLEVSALDAEKEMIAKGDPLPATDADDLPASLLQLRKTYREAQAKYLAERDKKAAPLYTIYVKALDDYVVELTKAGRIDDAQKVRQLRDEIAAKGGLK